MKQLRNEQGYALAIAVLVITVLSILGISLMATTGNSKKMANKEQENQAAYYIAEAGMNLKKAEIKKAADQFRKDTAGWKDSKLEEALKQPPKINISTTYNSKNSNGTDKVFDTNNASAKVTVEYTTKPGAKTTTDNQTKAVQNYIYKIKSVGMIDNQKRTITSTMSYDLTVNSEEQAKPDEEIDGYYPIEGIPEASIHALEGFGFYQQSLKGKLLFGFDKSKVDSSFPFKKYNENTGNGDGKGSGVYYYNKSNSVKFDTCNNKACLELGNNMTFNRPDQVKLYPFPTKEFIQLKNNYSPPINYKPLPTFTNENYILPSGNYIVNDLTSLKSINISSNNVSLYLPDGVFSQGSYNIHGNGQLKIITSDFSINGSSNIAFDKNTVEIFSYNSLSVLGSAKITNSKSLVLKSNNLDLTTSKSINSIDRISIFSNKIFLLQANLISKETFIFYNGPGNEPVSAQDFENCQNPSNEFNFSINHGREYTMNIDINGGYYSQFNLKKLNGYVILRGPAKNDAASSLCGTNPTFNNSFFYAPQRNIKIISNKNFKGVLVAKNINVIQGQVEYAEPSISPSKPPTNENGGNNGSNNGDSIIIDSSFSDAIDSGTVEIDNER